MALICLLSNTLGIGVAVATGHGCSLSHGIHHGHLTLGGVLVLVLIVQKISIHIIRELLPVQDLVDGIIQLSLPGRGIFSRFIYHLQLEHNLCLPHGITFLIVTILESGVSGFSGGSGGCRSVGIGSSAIGILIGGIGAIQRTPGVGTNDTVNVQIVLLLEIRDRTLRVITEYTILIQIIAMIIQQLLKLSYIAALGTITELIANCSHFYLLLKFSYFAIRSNWSTN